MCGSEASVGGLNLEGWGLRDVLGSNVGWQARMRRSVNGWMVAGAFGGAARHAQVGERGQPQISSGPCAQSGAHRELGNRPELGEYWVGRVTSVVWLSFPVNVIEG